MTASRPDPFDHLTGRLSGLPRPVSISAPGKGGKFTPAGDVLPFPGNTVLFHIDPRSDAHAALTQLQDALRAVPWAARFAFLPPASFHMTLFQGVSGNPPTADHWPQDVPAGLDRDALTATLLDRLAGVPMPAAHYHIRASGLFAGHSITVEGADPAQERALRAAREVLRNRMQLSPPDFDGYVFHISLGYLLEWLPYDIAQQVIEDSRMIFDRFALRLQNIRLGLPEFCNFEDMCHFEPQALLPASETVVS